MIVVRQYLCGREDISKLDSVRNKVSRSNKDSESYFKERQQEVKAAKKLIIRRCVICEQDFEATGNQPTCKRPHYRNCKVCGEPFEVNRTSNVRSTCSGRCWQELKSIKSRNSSNLEL